MPSRVLRLSTAAQEALNAETEDLSPEAKTSERVLAVVSRLRALQASTIGGGLPENVRAEDISGVLQGLGLGGAQGGGMTRREFEQALDDRLSRFRMQLLSDFTEEDPHAA